MNTTGNTFKGPRFIYFFEMTDGTMVRFLDRKSHTPAPRNTVSEAHAAVVAKVVLKALEAVRAANRVRIAKPAAAAAGTKLMKK